MKRGRPRKSEIEKQEDKEARRTNIKYVGGVPKGVNTHPKQRLIFKHQGRFISELITDSPMDAVIASRKWEAQGNGRTSEIKPL